MYNGLNLLFTSIQFYLYINKSQKSPQSVVYGKNPTIFF